MVCAPPLPVNTAKCHLKQLQTHNDHEPPSPSFIASPSGKTSKNGRSVKREPARCGGKVERSLGTTPLLNIADLLLVEADSKQNRVLQLD